MVGRVDEDHFAAATAEFGEQGDEDSNTGAVNVTDFGEVDGAVDDVVAEMVVNRLEKLFSIGAADEVAGEMNEEDAVLNGGGSGHT